MRCGLAALAELGADSLRPCIVGKAPESFEDLLDAADPIEAEA